MGGAIQVETVFSWPGLGRLVYDAVLRRDYPLLEASFLVFAVTVILANYLSDIAYMLLDPRVRQA
jgi:peptide/nickel transport system permease protein